MLNQSPQNNRPQLFLKLDTHIKSRGTTPISPVPMNREGWSVLADREWMGH